MALPPAHLLEALTAVGAFLAKRRPAAHLRDKLDFRAVITGSEVTLVEVRPHYQDKTRIIEHPFARAKWVGTRQVWRLFWMRGNLKWTAYEPIPEAPALAALLAEVERDPHCCFLG